MDNKQVANRTATGVTQTDSVIQRIHAAMKDQFTALNLSYLLLARDMAKYDMSMAKRTFQLQEPFLEALTRASNTSIALVAGSITQSLTFKPALPENAWWMIASVLNGDGDAGELSVYIASQTMKHGR